jgi:hypothetical protein
MLNIYVAGPFFNDESRKELQTIAGNLEKMGHKLFLPMRDGIMCPKDANAAMRKKVFDLDCQKIAESNLIVAMLDYPLPLGQRLILKSRSPEGPEKEVEISLPDVGTVFELGVMSILQSFDLGCKGIVGYCEHQKGGFNLMLEVACQAIVHNLTDLKLIVEFLEKDDEVSLKNWKEKQNLQNLEEI